MALYGSELSIDDGGLALYGENVARLLKITGKVRAVRSAAAVKKDLSLLQKRYVELSALYAGARHTPAVAEWFLDNYFLARGEALKAIDELKTPARLPAEKGVSALYWLCLCLVRCGEGKLGTERCRLFFEGCQSIYVLGAREISLLVAMLRAALISELAALYGEGTLTGECATAAERLFTSLRLISTFDFSELLESIDRVEQLYRDDPAGVYPQMHEKTRANYKARTALLARRHNTSELRVAERVLFLSRGVHDERRHIGHWLFEAPLGNKKPAHKGAVYVLANVLITLTLSAVIGAALSSLPAFLLLLLPVSEIVKLTIDLALLKLLPPAHVPRIDLEEGGVPVSARTVCVISALLTSEKSGPKLSRRLEEYRLANLRAGENLIFGILGDLPDADAEVSPADGAIIAAAKDAIDALNAKYGCGFFLFLRPRVWSPRDGKYMAYERKRGAIMGLARLIEGENSDINCLSGSRLALRGTRYILTLDEDTRLTPDSALALIGAMLHPQNRPVVSREKRKVVAGHAIIQPRMSTELSAVGKSGFSRIFAPHGGTDPYGCDCSEVYMDAFRSGGFAGKGVIDVRAFLMCMNDAIPENTVLSHDALEGAYLRGGLMTDVELLDGYPSDILSFYRRRERWTRGDWQNLPWLFRRGAALGVIDRFRLFDSLRRSVLSPACFLAFVSAFFTPHASLATPALIALFALTLRLFQALWQSLFREANSTRLRFRSRLIRGVNEALMQTFLTLLLLPYDAYICVSAAATAVWRMAVSHRNMLSWTPASAFDGAEQGAVKFYANMWFPVAVGLALAIFATSVIGKAAGALWLLAPAIALALSRPRPAKARAVPAEERQYLLTCASKIWAFFEEFCTPQDHFLPPDNFQERPPAGLAHRSSPTNIGLCLISCVAAIDLGLTRPDAALGIVENVLATMRRMPKWDGHLYNWYDTQTLRPLHPAYVSTVDSGNLAVCLMILREALLELGKPELAAQCGELLAPMSFAPLYDKKRRLFSIGLDTEKGGLSKSYYDLMASEARTVSFIAVARGEIPKRHWQALSRAQVQKGYRRGCVSWTGTMFEYLMPRLFFKSRAGSLIYETDRFCVDVQKNRTKKAGTPWGISESAYYSLDPSLNYRYKAHGVGALAIKRGQDRELVVSPYSSFLALCCDRKAAISNLKKIEESAPQGKYGFWDAIDFTPGRTNAPGGEIVRCVMAHHLGMSLVAIANSLADDAFPARLMRDPAMGAFSCLLEEKLPLNGTVLRRRETKTPEKPPRGGSIFWEKRGGFTDHCAPECCALSNGSYNLLLTDSGASHAAWNGMVPYFTPRETPCASHGVDLWLELGSALVPLLPAPDAGDCVKPDWKLTLLGAKISTEQGGFRAQTVVSVSSEVNGEKRRVSVSPHEGVSQKCRLIIGMRPVLAAFDDYINHPAFYGLGLEAYAQDGAVMVRRLKRGKNPDCYMCLAASVPLEFSARREDVPGRGGLYSAVQNGLNSEGGGLNDPYICASAPLRLATGGDSHLTFAIAVGLSEKEAYGAAQRILVEPDSRAADFPASYAKSLGMNEKQIEAAMELLRTTRFPDTKIVSHPTSELWRFGVSGDYSLITQSVNSEEDLEDATSLMLCHNFLTTLGHTFDLVFLTDEGGDYMRKLSGSLESLRRGVGAGSGLIRAIDRSQTPEVLSEFEAIPRERSVDGKSVQYKIPPSLDAAPRQSYPEISWDEAGGFTFCVNRSLPPRAWGNMLTNGHFGFFATDCGTGHMWFENAREYHINRWLCDALTTEGTERLMLSGASVFATPDDADTKVTYGFGYARWEKEICGTPVTTEVCVPCDTNARVLVLTWDGEPMEISWYTDLVLGGDPNVGRGLSVSVADGVITAQSADSPFPDFPFRVCASEPYDSLVTEREKWFCVGELADCRACDCLGVTFRAESPFVLVCGCDEPEKLVALTAKNLAFDSLIRTKNRWGAQMSRVKIKTPLPSLDRLMNGWLPYEALACRIMGRCSIYQSGGAVGFRDQLQDAVNLILLDPALAKTQILLCCRRQYEQGDVMHWWHTLQGGSKGVRTRCSDDLLWLPWALCEYVEKTGDYSLCDAPAPWLVSPELKDGERDRYESAVLTGHSDSVLTHCKRALERIVTRGVGGHNLLLIGGGDWNDGFDAVGETGGGESVWLSWFFSHTAHRFAALLTRQNEKEVAARFDAAAHAVGQSANEAWDGDWFLRGYFDDGTPLGSHTQECCQIDSIAQSFAELCPEADKARTETALSSAVERLFDRENGLINLFTPPFSGSNPCPGYIESYGKGFRENGGQYTHAAVWLAAALLREGRVNEGFELISALIPEGKDGEIYKAEPFVLAADISSNPACAGQAGWSWYTGAAGWMWRVVLEGLLGLSMADGKLSFSPRLPDVWRDKHVSVEIDGKIVWTNEPNAGDN